MLAKVGEMPNIGRAFKVKSYRPDGCAKCGSTLYEDDLVAYVDKQITCKPCVDKIKAESPLLQKAIGKHVGNDNKGGAVR
jgi:hypothetical protein